MKKINIGVKGFVIAKENSNRFPGKNFHEVHGKPLFCHAVDTLLNSIYIDTVYIATNSDLPGEYYKYNERVQIINRGPHISKDDQSLYEVLKFMFYSVDQKCDIIACILANTIRHLAVDIDRGIELLKLHKNLKDVRSYDAEGVENGIVILRADIFDIKHEISAYVGAIHTEGQEIHYQEDLDGVT